MGACTLIPPHRSYRARHAGEAVYPHLWDRLIYGWAPSLGYLGDWVYDVIQGGRHLTLSHKNWGINSLPPPHGHRGEAPIFNGTSDWAQSETVLHLSDTPRLTLAFWLYWDVNDTSGDIFLETNNNYNANENTLVISPSSDLGAGLVTLAFHPVMGAAGIGDYNIRTIPAPSAARWHHWMLCLDRNGGVNQWHSAYIDGVPQTISNPGLGADNTTSGHFGTFIWYFFSRAGSQFFGAGRLGDFYVWKRLLGQKEAWELYGGASPLYLRQPALASSVVATAWEWPEEARRWGQCRHLTLGRRWGQWKAD